MLREPSRALRSVLLFGALALGACGGSVKAPESRAVTSQRLQGQWILMSFHAETPFEPMLDGLLRAQLGALRVDVEGKNVRAAGIGVVANRTFEISEARGDTFKGILYDEGGVPYNLTGQFQPDALLFTSLDPPWRGHGTLQRRR